MRIEVLPIGQLSEPHVDSWRRIQMNGDAALRSPFLSPDYARLVNEVKGNVEVAVFESDGDVVGFFPFSRTSRHVAEPVGGSLCDYQGVVAADGVTWNPDQLLRECRLRTWRFDHLVGHADVWRPHCLSVGESPFMDLASGFDAYFAAAGSACVKQIRDVRRRARKMSEQLGPPTFTLRSDSSRALDQLIRWKKEQYRRIQSVDHLTPTAVEIVRRTVACDGPHFFGMMSTLTFGDDLAAVHVGLLSNGVLHSWFPAYNREWSSGSPGLSLLLHIAEAAADEGIRVIDFGRGDEMYKRQLASGANNVAAGFVELRSAPRILRRMWHGTREWIRHSPMRAPAQSIVRGARTLMRFGQSSSP